MRDFNQPGTFLLEGTAGHNNPGGSINNNLLIQVTDKLVRGGAQLRAHTHNKEGLVEDAKAEDKLGCSDPGMVEFRILRGAE